METVKVNKDGMFSGGVEAVELMRLRSIAMGLKLEQKGMRLTAKAPKMTTICRQQYKLKGRTAADFEPQIMQMIQDKMATLRKEGRLVEG